MIVCKIMVVVHCMRGTNDWPLHRWAGGSIKFGFRGHSKLLHVFPKNVEKCVD